MKIKLTHKNNLYDDLVLALLFISLVLMFFGLNKYASSFMLPASLMVFSKKKYHLSQIKPLYIIIFIGLFSSIYSNNFNNYYFFKDLVFFVQVPILITLGLYIGQRPLLLYRVIKMFIFFYLFFILFDLFKISLFFDELLSNGIEFHDKYNTNNINAVLLFIILHFLNKKKSTLFSKKYFHFSIIISVIYILFSFSRTKIILLLLILVFININSKKKIILFYLILLAPIFVQLIGLYFNLEAKNNSDTGFLAKSFNSLNELQIKSFDNQYDITHNWRGFEAFLGFDKFLNGDQIQFLFGQGFGAFVEVPDWAFTDWRDSNLEGLKNIGIFHIGFITILVKSGIIGLLYFFYFLYYFFKKENLLLFQNNLTQALIIVIIISTYLTHGLITPTLNPFLLIFLGISLNDFKYNKS